jgi:hypothetical protein
MRTPVTSDKIYVILGLIMLMGIVQKPTQKPYFSRVAFVETPIFPQTMTHDRFELIMKFLHFVDNSTVNISTGTKNIIKIHPLLKIRKTFHSAYLPAQLSVDESLTLWKGHIQFQIIHSAKGSEIQQKNFSPL